MRTKINAQVVHWIININGYDLTKRKNGAYYGIRKTAQFSGNAHKLLINIANDKYKQ